MTLSQACARKAALTLLIVNGEIKMPKFFVLINSQTGLQPQMWHVEQVNGEGKEKPCLFKYQLTDAEEIAFDSGATTLSDYISRFKDHATQD